MTLPYVFLVAAIVSGKRMHATQPQNERTFKNIQDQMKFILVFRLKRL